MDLRSLGCGQGLDRKEVELFPRMTGWTGGVVKLVYKVLKGVQSLVLHCPTENIGSYQSSVLLRVYVGKQGPRGAVVRATEARAS